MQQHITSGTTTVTTNHTHSSTHNILTSNYMHTRDDPLSIVTRPPDDEPENVRRVRVEKERVAKGVSDAIDEAIAGERNVSRHDIFQWCN